MYATGFTAAIALCVCLLATPDVLSSPRFILTAVVLMWLRLEWRLLTKADALRKSLHEYDADCTHRMVRETMSLSQTVHNLSEQHRLLCEMRSGILKTVRLAQDILSELRHVEQPSSPTTNSPPIVPCAVDVYKHSPTKNMRDAVAAASDPRAV
jgi:hypothetical protein